MSPIWRTRAQHLDVALALEQLLELVGVVEVVLDRPLLAAGDDDDLLDAGGDRLFDAVLDDRLVDQRQHLLGLRLGGGQEPCAPAGGREDCFSNAQNDPRELCVGGGGSPVTGPAEAGAVYPADLWHHSQTRGASVSRGTRAGVV